MKWLLVVASLAAMSARLAAAPVTSLDDIRYWVGEGANRAALAFDWDGDALDDEALVWGYRWDGDVSAERMVRDVIAQDDRLYAKLGSHSLGLAVLGIGYDLDNDGAFAIDDGTAFDATGVAYVSLQNADGAAALAADLYAEGWNDAYWHFSVGTSGAAGPAWSTSLQGASGRLLADGAWYGYAIAVTLNANEFPRNLIAAEPPHAAGDFNGDGLIDAADYTVWRDAQGPPEGYAIWAAGYGATSPPSLSTPEPTATSLVGLLFLLLSLQPKERV